MPTQTIHMPTRLRKDRMAQNRGHAYTKCIRSQLSNDHDNPKSLEGHEPLM